MPLSSLGEAKTPPIFQKLLKVNHFDRLNRFWVVYQITRDFTSIINKKIKENWWQRANFFNILSYFSSPNKTYKVTVSVQLLNDFDQLSTFWGSFSAKNYPFLVISDLIFTYLPCNWFFLNAIFGICRQLCIGNGLLGFFQLKILASRFCSQSWDSN